MTGQYDAQTQKYLILEFPLWYNGIDSVSAAAGICIQSPTQCSGLSISCCHSCEVDCNSGLDLIPGPGIPYAAGQQKKTLLPCPLQTMFAYLGYRTKKWQIAVTLKTLNDSHKQEVE